MSHWKTEYLSKIKGLRSTVINTVERVGCSVSRILSLLEISRFWYFSQISFFPIIDGGFNL